MTKDKAKDDEYFNCSQDHEHDYVKNLYKQSEEVGEWLKKKCADGTISYTTHKELYDMLKKAGFTKK